MNLISLLAAGVAVIAGGRFVYALLDPGVVHDDLTNTVIGCVALLWIAFHLLVSALRKERDDDSRRPPPRGLTS